MDYEGDGGFCLDGLAVPEIIKRYVTKFSLRENAWSKQSAQRGRLEKVTIKKIKLLYPERPYPVPLYIDTYNSYWNEEMLLTHAEAIATATNYYAKQIVDLDAALEVENPNSCSL